VADDQGNSGIVPPPQTSGNVIPFPGSETRSTNPPTPPGGSGPNNPGIEARVAKLESDVGHIRSDLSEIKSLLSRLAPRIDEMYGKLSYFSTKEDVANLKTEIERRPTRRQSVFDIFTVVGFIGVLLAIGARLAK
jgi:hypothetical protein